MKWIRKPLPNLGDRRQRSGFLWLPKRIGNEIRWLERACWIEEWQEVGVDIIKERHWQGVEWR